MAASMFVCQFVEALMKKKIVVVALLAALAAFPLAAQTTFEEYEQDSRILPTAWRPPCR